MLWSRMRRSSAWHRIPTWLLGLVVSGWCVCGAAGVGQAPVVGPGAVGPFTPLEPLPAPKILDSSPAYPGPAYVVQHLVDGSERTEYSSQGQGTGTFVVFDFGKPVRLAAFEHVDRADPATIAASELTFADDAAMSKLLGKVSVRHANTRAGRTMLVFPEPITARYVRWQVTELGPDKYGTVGGSEIRFYRAAQPDPKPLRSSVELVAVPAVMLKQDKATRTLQARINYPYAEGADATLQVSGAGPDASRLSAGPVALRLSTGLQTAELPLPAQDTPATVHVSFDVAGQKILEKDMVLQPVRHWEIYILPHSHVDIGYTHVQTEVEKLQWKYLEEAIAIARRTANYPPGAQFKWNTEVLWAVDSYLKQAAPDKRKEFIEAVKAGQVHLDGMYGNMLTGLCRPEELFRLFDCARRVARQCGVTIDSAMISDVPGWTWGIVPAMAHNGIKYFSMGPNHIHRIGYTLQEWGDKPFYWVSPSGQEKVLCWVAGKGYAWFHPGLSGRINQVKPESFFGYLRELEHKGFPYEMVQLRYSIGGDNGPPDPELPDFVKKWNERYVWPKLRIATTRELFQEFERRYKEKIPSARGDFTPYWEDGAASSAKETALARNAAEGLVQTEALFALLNPAAFPRDEFYQAWRNVLLYNEHTWGAHCSITQPDSDFTKAQWKIKQAFAVDAAEQSLKLRDLALTGRDLRAGSGTIAAVDVLNTASWPRTDLVELPKGLTPAGPVVKDSQGNQVPSQVGANGQLVFLAPDVPPLGAKRFVFEAGEPRAVGQAKVEDNVLSNGKIRLVVSETTGAIRSFTLQGVQENLAAGPTGLGLNEYFYVAGRNSEAAVRDASARSRDRDTRLTIALGERGPLRAGLDVLSQPPGCKRLIRTVTLVDGLDYLTVVDVLDKARVRTPEAVHLAFAPNVPEGILRMDIPWGIIRPEHDQLPGSCKNYFSVGRWVDVSNSRFGVTWATLDAPLVEVGQIAMDVRTPFDPKAFLSTVPPSQTFYSYVMNNYWETNYKADNEGTVVFRYAVRPHGPFDPAAAARFGIERSQPLVVRPVAQDAPPVRSMFFVEPAEVLVTSLKPSEDGKALMIRLYNAGEQPAQARLNWAAFQPNRVARSSPFEEEGPALSGPIDLPPLGIVTLRAARR